MRLPWSKAAAAVFAVSFAVFSWTSGPITVDVQKSPMNIKVSADGKTLAEITGITFGGTNYSSIESSVTEPNNDLTLTLGGSAKIKVSAVESGVRFAGRVKGVSNIKLTMKDAGDHFFGITEKSAYFKYYGSPDLRGRTIQCVVWSQPNNEHQGTHNAWSAFYYSSHGYGGFFDTYAMGSYSFAVSGQTTITHDTDSLDWYMFYGPTGDKVHKAYYKIIGAPKSIPMWACGPQIWRDNPESADAVVKDVTNAGKMQLPLASYLLDRPFCSGPVGWGDMKFSNSFSNPEVWLKKTLLADNNVKAIAWHAPLTWGASYPPGTFTSNDYYYLDLSNPTSVAWYIEKLTKNFADNGVQGSKQDRVDENFPTGSAWHDGTPQPQRQAKIIYLNAKVTDSVYKVKYGTDQFNNSRGAYHRCQPYLSAVWGGDTPGTWDGLACSVDNTIRVGFIGFPMFGADISGYLSSMGSQPDNLHIRWTGFGTFSAYMEHHISGKRPWEQSEFFKTNCKFYYDLRMKLLPYVYSIVNTTVDNGVSMPGLQMVYPDDAKTYDICDEYFFGPAMLVAPIVKSGATSRSVYLPEGTWINFWDYADVQTGKQTITANAVLERIPVYIKANSLYPTGLIYPGNMKLWMPDFDSKRSITINAFPGSAGQSATFTYIDYLDNNKKKDMTVEARANNVVVVKSPALTVPGAVEVWLASAPAQVYLNGAAVSNPAYDAAAKKLTVPVAAGQQITLSVNEMVGVAGHGMPTFSYKGKLSVSPAGHGIALSIPAIDNAESGTPVRVSLFNMQGRCVWKSAITANPYTPTQVHIDCAKGAYLAVAKRGAVILDRQAIVVP